ncbi:MAG: HAD-IIA family hydrolase [Campylobacterales bacterium]|nr:HAD-IIA family hydrolase [Campylobacterales bacterium]
MYFIDVQGTLIDDEKMLPIAGAIEFINTLNKKNIPYVIITNNTKHESHKFLEYLNSIGFDISESRYLDPLMVLKSVVKDESVAVFGNSEFKQIVLDLGLKIDTQNPKILLVGLKKDYTNEDYADMIEYILKGAKILGIHATSLYNKDNKRYPGVGAILNMLKSATGSDFEVVGKSSKLFYKTALEKLNCDDFSKVTIISDDLIGDLIGAKELFMKTIFVLSGKHKTKDEIIPKISQSNYPDLIFDSINDLNKGVCCESIS